MEPASKTSPCNLDFLLCVYGVSIVQSYAAPLLYAGVDRHCRQCCGPSSLNDVLQSAQDTLFGPWVCDQQQLAATQLSMVLNQQNWIMKCLQLAGNRQEGRPEGPSSSGEQQHQVPCGQPLCHVPLNTHFAAQRVQPTANLCQGLAMKRSPQTPPLRCDHLRSYALRSPFE